MLCLQQPNNLDVAVKFTSCTLPQPVKILVSFSSGCKSLLRLSINNTTPGVQFKKIETLILFIYKVQLPKNAQIVLTGHNNLSSFILINLAQQTQVSFTNTVHSNTSLLFIYELGPNIKPLQSYLQNRNQQIGMQRGHSNFPHAFYYLSNPFHRGLQLSSFNFPLTCSPHPTPPTISKTFCWTPCWHHAFKQTLLVALKGELTNIPLVLPEHQTTSDTTQQKLAHASGGYGPRAKCTKQIQLFICLFLFVFHPVRKQAHGRSQQ